MNDRLDDHETETLIQGYLESSLSESECVRLNNLLSQKPEMVDLVLTGLRDNLFIRTVVAEWMVATTEKSARPAAARPQARRWLRIMLDLLRGRAGMAAAIGAAAVLILFWWWCFSPVVGAPVLANVQGTGVSLERSRRSLAAVEGTSLREGDIVRAGEGSTATIDFGPERTRVTILPGTEVRLRGVWSGKKFELDTGKLEASVARQRPFHPMILKSPHAEARVIGTRFALTVNTNSTRLDVTEGLVRFMRTSDKQFVRVGADHFAVAAPNYELCALPLTGSILREYWTNVPGGFYVTYLMSNTNYPDHPSGRDYLSKLETPDSAVTNYGARIRGYLLPPASGAYTFWITADDGGEFFLSPDDNPEHRQQIAHREPNGNIGQSAPVALKAGRRYYVEVLYKIGNANGHLTVEWQGPGRKREVISGEFLSPCKLK